MVFGGVYQGSSVKFPGPASFKPLVAGKSPRQTDRFTRNTLKSSAAPSAHTRRYSRQENRDLKPSLLRIWLWSRYQKLADGWESANCGRAGILKG